MSGSLAGCARFTRPSWLENTQGEQLGPAPDATGLCWASLDLVSGCGFDGDPVAECCELGEMVAKLTFGVQTTSVAP